MIEPFLPPPPHDPPAEMMIQVTVYRDGTFTVDGRAKQEAVPYVLRQIAEAVKEGHGVVDIPMN